jgi:hypothetical protein
MRRVLLVVSQRGCVADSFPELGRIDVIVSNVGYGLFDGPRSSPTRRAESTLTTLRRRIAEFEELAASSDFRPASEVHTVLS